jgi:hypothetical protein
LAGVSRNQGRPRRIPGCSHGAHHPRRSIPLFRGGRRAGLLRSAAAGRTSPQRPQNDRRIPYFFQTALALYQGTASLLASKQKPKAAEVRNDSRRKGTASAVPNRGPLELAFRPWGTAFHFYPLRSWSHAVPSQFIQKTHPAAECESRPTDRAPTNHHRCSRYAIHLSPCPQVGKSTQASSPKIVIPTGGEAEAEGPAARPAHHAQSISGCLR